MAEKIKRLYRSKERVLGGVCAGVAEYFNVDPVLVRFLWAIWALVGGMGLLAYVIGWILIPERP